MLKTKARKSNLIVFKTNLFEWNYPINLTPADAVGRYTRHTINPSDHPTTVTDCEPILCYTGYLSRDGK